MCFAGEMSTTINLLFKRISGSARQDEFAFRFNTFRRSLPSSMRAHKIFARSPTTKDYGSLPFRNDCNVAIFVLTGSLYCFQDLVSKRSYKCLQELVSCCRIWFDLYVDMDLLPTADAHYQRYHDIKRDLYQSVDKFISANGHGLGHASDYIRQGGTMRAIWTLSLENRSAIMPHCDRL